MKVSCICPTYNRVAARKHLLEEAVQSFLLQDYEDSELIVLNDHPEQQIVFEHPRVRIINHPTRFGTLGEKYNYGIAIAKGKYICPWEDDDISLPHRISLSVLKIGDADYFNPKAYFFMSGGKVLFEGPARGYSHNCSMFKRSAWSKVGGYKEISGPQDAAMDTALRKECSVVNGPLTREEAFFIYRWGVSDLHLSGHSDPQKAYDDYEKQATQTGEFILKPHWGQDYTNLVKNESIKVV